MKGEELRDLSDQSLKWWGILYNGLMSSITEYNAAFVAKYVTPYAKALFLSESKAQIEEGLSFLGNCLRNEDSIPLYLQEAKVPHLIERGEGPLISNFYHQIGKYQHSSFKVSYRLLCKEAPGSLLHVCEEVLDATLKAFKENEKDTHRFTRVLSAI